MRLIRIPAGLLAGLSLTLLSGAAIGAQPGTVSVGSAGVIRYLEKGQPPVVIHLTVEQARNMRAPHKNHGKPGGHSKTNDLIYNGGTGGIGVETAPKIYLVFWGSQWSSDPSNEAGILEEFLNSMGGSSWLASVTQYCQGVKSGTIFCKSGSGVTFAGNEQSMLYGVWYDNSTAPSKPRQSQIAAEAVSAAQYFGNETTDSNANAQYVIATATGNNSSGFGRQYCAYHSYTTSAYGDIAYTNLPYITDAGASCGANFNGLGKDAGITIVEGHEAAETITDPFPSSGWVDSSGSEIGDKCAWISSGQGAAADVSFDATDSDKFGTSTITEYEESSNSNVPDDTFPVQSLWSNAFNSGAGGCVLSY